MANNTLKHAYLHFCTKVVLQIGFRIDLRLVTVSGTTSPTGLFLKQRRGT